MKNISLLLFLALLVNSCEISSECEKCQAAIDHMKDKIADNSCNPEKMQTAWDNIRTDCGAMGDTYVGYMAEACLNGKLGESPKCENQTLKISSPKFYYHTFNELPEPVEVTVELSKLSESESDNFVFDGKRIYKEFPYTVNEGDIIKVTLWKPGTNDVLASASKAFTFERNYNWINLRGIDISFNKASGHHLISFDDWEESGW